MTAARAGHTAGGRELSPCIDVTVRRNRNCANGLVRAEVHHVPVPPVPSRDVVCGNDRADLVEHPGDIKILARANDNVDKSHLRSSDGATERCPRRAVPVGAVANSRIADIEAAAEIYIFAVFQNGVDKAGSIEVPVGNPVNIIGIGAVRGRRAKRHGHEDGRN